MTTSGRTLRAIGLMSGTSMDGVDAALLKSDGTAITPFGPGFERPYDEAERSAIAAAVTAAAGLERNASWPDALHRAAKVVTAAHEEAVHALLDKAGLSAGAVDLIGW